MARGNRALVTGGAGYIGSHVVLALLEAGWQVVIIDDLSTGRRGAVPPEAGFIEGDIGEPAVIGTALSRHRPDVILHFAGSIVVSESVADPLKYYRNNTCASRTLLDAAVTHGVGSFLFSSTAAVYGVPARVPIDEETPTAPINPYGRSKLCTEFVLRDVAAATSMLKSDASFCKTSSKPFRPTVPAIDPSTSATRVVERSRVMRAKSIRASVWSSATRTRC